MSSHRPHAPLFLAPSAQPFRPPPALRSRNARPLGGFRKFIFRLLRRPIWEAQ